MKINQPLECFSEHLRATAKERLMSKNGFQILDSDLHISEPDFWQQYIDPEFKDRAPRLVPYNLDPQRADIPVPWMAGWSFEVDGRMLGWATQRGPHFKGAIAEVAHRAADRVKEAVDRDFDPTSQLQAMDREGLDRAALFPTHSLHLTSTDTLDPKLSAAIARAYNDWLFDFCQADRNRLFGIAMVTPLDIQAAIIETRRAVTKLGFRGIFIRPNPMKGRNWYDPYYDPLWAECENLNVPVTFHGAEVVAPEIPSVGKRFVEYLWLEHGMSHSGEQMLAMASIIGGGVLERFPKLRVAFLEGNCSWVPFLLWRLDRGWSWVGNMEMPEMTKKPSDYFREGRCFVSVEADEDLVNETIRRVGDDCIVFSTDYPHMDTEYPYAVETFMELPIDENGKKKILWDNCVRLYAL